MRLLCLFLACCGAGSRHAPPASSTLRVRSPAGFVRVDRMALSDWLVHERGACRCSLHLARGVPGPTRRLLRTDQLPERTRDGILHPRIAITQLRNRDVLIDAAHVVWRVSASGRPTRLPLRNRVRGIVHELPNGNLLAVVETFGLDRDYKVGRKKAILVELDPDTGDTFTFIRGAFELQSRGVSTAHPFAEGARVAVEFYDHQIAAFDFDGNALRSWPRPEEWILSGRGLVGPTPHADRFLVRDSDGGVDRLFEYSVTGQVTPFRCEGGDFLAFDHEGGMFVRQGDRTQLWHRSKAGEATQLLDVSAQADAWVRYARLSPSGRYLMVCVKTGPRYDRRVTLVLDLKGRQYTALPTTWREICWIRPTGS